MQIDSPTSGSLHDAFSVLLAKSAGKGGLVVTDQVVVHERLTAELVHSLQDLVACRIAQSWEEGEEFGADRCARLVFEDDLRDLRDRK